VSGKEEFRHRYKMTVFWNMTPCILVGRLSYQTTSLPVPEYRNFDTDWRENMDLTVETFA
jgi:hypothetical protein